jgi:hypothetical protein
MGMFQLARRAAGRAGVDLVPRRYWSPIPYDVPEHVWARRSPLAGVEFDVSAQAERFERIAQHAQGWAPPGGNRMYVGMDAIALFGMLRELAPRRVVELGSGVSTEIIRHALGRPHDVYDPYRNERTSLAVQPVSATEVPLDRFRQLESGDVLFVDTSHTVKVGSDVNRIILDILPVLAPGVVVHLHDIFLPFEYSRDWAERGLYWAEQYLLQAFLIGNRDWEVLLGCAAVQDAYPELVVRYVSEPHGPQNRPGAFWMRRRPAAG